MRHHPSSPTIESPVVVCGTAPTQAVSIRPYEGYVTSAESRYRTGNSAQFSTDTYTCCAAQPRVITKISSAHRIECKDSNAVSDRHSTAVVFGVSRDIAIISPALAAEGARLVAAMCACAEGRAP
jgi:hypothetical protein